MNTVLHGPLPEETMLTSGLDFYKPTMSQLAHEYEPGAHVTFTFKNRGSKRLADYIDPAALQARFDTLQTRHFRRQDVEYLASLTQSDAADLFTDDYLEYVTATPLPEVIVTEENDDIAIQTTGEWSMATFWETIVLSEVNEAYFESLVRTHGLDILAIYDEGDRRLQEKIAILQANPDIKIAEFGTRRHFSLRWQDYVLSQLLSQCPENIVGTSNVALARKYDVPPIGTFAHEMPMVYCGLADSRGEPILDGHNRVLQDWYNRYGYDLSIALSDTYGSDFFFHDFSPEQADQWRGLRHDSGDPYDFGEQAIAFYQSQGIDPTTKTIVFSDGLDIGTIVDLHHYFQGRVALVFGWGTTLTNDLGLETLNVVMKATQVNGTDTVKLSDEPGKHTGPDDKVSQYEYITQTITGASHV